MQPFGLLWQGFRHEQHSRKELCFPLGQTHDRIYTQNEIRLLFLPSYPQLFQGVTTRAPSVHMGQLCWLLQGRLWHLCSVLAAPETAPNAQKEK